MKLNAYTIYDRKALTYSRPFFEVADGAAVRLFSDLANDANTQIGRHPSDFVLFGVGAFDDQSGIVLPETIRHIADALPLVRNPEPLPFDPQPRPAAGPANGHAGSQDK